MEEESVEVRCAHLLFHGDDVVGLQWLLKGLSSSKLCEFPSLLVPTSDRTFLMACAKQGRVSCCKLLLSLDSAASVNAQNCHGYTALHYASYQGHIELAFLLLAAGADWRILNTHGESAYQTAISGKNYELVNRYQVSPYFVDNYYAPINCTVAMSKHDAAQYKLEIVNVDSGGDRSLIGQEFHCLATTQRAVNSTVSNDLCGSTFEASRSIHHGSDDLYLGRGRSNHICMNDLSLSKQHAVICYIENMGFIVYDIGSKHGTFVNKERLQVGTDVYVNKTTTVNNTDTNEEVKKPDSGETITDGTLVSGCDISEINSTAVTLQDTVKNIPTTNTTNASDTACATDTTGASTTTIVSQQEVLRVPTYLLEGMLVQFGRVHCKVVRRRQEAVLSSKFQPTATLSTQSTESALHHLAVQQRVRALLNVPDDVAVHTTGQSGKRAGSGAVSSSRSDTGVGQKRKLAHSTTHVTTQMSTTLRTLPTIQPVPQPLPTDLNASNKGMQMLQRYGWAQGTAIGKSGSVASEPIEVKQKLDRAGIGCNTVGADSANGSTVTHVIDAELDSEKTKAWKRMMARFAEPR